MASYVLTQRGYERLEQRISEKFPDSTSSRALGLEIEGLTRQTIDRIRNRNQGFYFSSIQRLCSALGWTIDVDFQEGEDYQKFNPVEQQFLLTCYKIISQLNKNDYCITYLCEDVRNQCQVVIKRFDNQADQEGRKRFKRQVDALSCLTDHPQIPQTLSKIENDTPDIYLVYEYVEGQPLRELFNAHPKWTEEKVIILLKDILNILQFVHSKNYVHRDLKPENFIRRSADDLLFLVDFSSVKEIFLEPKTVSYAGTQGYQAPELASGEAGEYSDIYSVGIIGIEALTGIRPTKVKTGFKTLADKFSYYQVQVSEKLTSILAQMTHRNEAQRYSTVEKVLNDLSSLTNL